MRAGSGPRFGELAGHCAIGAGLGIYLSLTLIVHDRVFDMIAHSARPALTALTSIGVITAVLAVGSTLTGLIFSSIEAGRE
jgi:hypothetical protein